MMNYRGKLCGSSAIILHSPCRIGDFCLRLPSSTGTTACKQGIVPNLLTFYCNILNKFIDLNIKIVT